ncbi:MAG: hypothetical protein QM757_23355 [Paludibaculum sp.]
MPATTPVPDTLSWDLWLGTAAGRPFSAGDAEYTAFVAERNARSGRPNSTDGFACISPSIGAAPTISAAA